MNDEYYSAEMSTNTATTHKELSFQLYELEKEEEDIKQQRIIGQKDIRECVQRIHSLRQRLEYASI